METVLTIIAGMGIGFFLGEQYILWKMKKGIILPVNPYALPSFDKKPKLESTLTDSGISVKEAKQPPKMVFIDKKSNLRGDDGEIS